MSAEAHPITPTRFKSALQELPISSLYAKYAELQNSISHMESSNKQLEEYARENDDRECYEALLENRLVIKRFLERMDAVKVEVVEVRGLPWRPRGGEDTAAAAAAAATVNGANGVAAAATATEGGIDASDGVTQHQSRNNGDAGNQDGDEEGVFL